MLSEAVWKIFKNLVLNIKWSVFFFHKDEITIRFKYVIKHS